MLYTGRLLWNIRESLGISRENLSEGLCSVSYLTHIENNKRDADKLLFEGLYQRMGKYSGRFEMLLDVDEYERLEKRWEICDTIDRGNYKDAKSKIDEYRSNKCGHLEEQYMCLIECEVMHRTGAKISSCMEMLLAGLRQTRSNFDINKLDEYYLSRMEMLLIHQYVRYIELSGEEEEAVKLYKVILNILEEARYDRSERELLYRHVGYWLMKYYLRHERYDSALEIAEKTYEYTLNGDFIMFLTELKEGIIICLEHKGKDMSEEKKYIEVLNEFKKEYGVRNAEDFFPRYEEINSYNVNEIISQRRKMLGLSQEELAYGICDISTVSLMENNRRRLQKEKKEKLLQRVNLSGDKYISRVDTYDYTVFEKINEIRDLRKNGGQSSIENVLNKIQEEYKIDSVNSRQFLLGTINEYDIVQGNKDEQRLSQLKQILSESLRDLDKANLDNVILLHNEWNLIHKIILWYKTNRNYKECMKYLERIINTYNDSMINKNTFMYIQVKSIMGDVLGEMKIIDMAESELQKAMKVSVKKDTMAHIRLISYIMAWNLLVEKDNISEPEQKKCRNNLRLAYVLAKIYKNDRAVNRAAKLAEQYSIVLGVV